MGTENTESTGRLVLISKFDLDFNVLYPPVSCQISSNAEIIEKIISLSSRQTDIKFFPLEQLSQRSDFAMMRRTNRQTQQLKTIQILLPWYLQAYRHLDYWMTDQSNTNVKKDNTGCNDCMLQFTNFFILTLGKESRIISNQMSR